MGHEVITVGPAVGAWLPWAEHRNLEPYEWKPDVGCSYQRHMQLTYEYAEAIARAGFKPDLIIQMDAQFMLEGKPDCPNVLWAIDNHVAKYGAYDTFDRVYIAHSWGYMRDLPQARFLPCAHDPQHHHRLDGVPRAFDVGLVGVGYEERQALVYRLLDEGVTVKAATGLVYGEYNTLYNQCKIALVRSTAGDLAMRVFENMAQGCLVVADRCRDFEKVGLVEGVHYLGYDTPDECSAQVRHALAHWQDMERIVAAAGEWVKPQTWEERAKVILNDNL